MGYLTLWGHLWRIRDPPGGFIKELAFTRNLPEDFYRPENAHF
jgi:hypothetical protein